MVKISYSFLFKRLNIQCLILCFFLFNSFFSMPLLLAQTNSLAIDQTNFIAEKILLHTDRQIYISGETIWFKVYTLGAQQNKLADFSKVGYLELISPTGAPVSRVKILLEKGLGNGTIEVPTALKSGKYTLRAYTQAMRNLGKDAFGVQNLLILNPTQAIVKDTIGQENFTLEESMPILVSSSDHLNIQVEPSKKSYLQRDLASMEISVTNEKGEPITAELSLGITLKTSKNHLLFESTSKGNNSNDTFTKNDNKFPTENRGMRIEGKVINESSGKGAPGVNIFIAFPGKRALVYTATTSEDGDFSVLLPKMYGLRQVIVQIQPPKNKPLSIQIKDPFHENLIKEEPPFILPAKWESLATNLLINAQIENAYQAFELPSEYQSTNPHSNVSFFGEPVYRYKLDDFTRFPLPEFFYEVVPEVRVKGKFGEERLAVSLTQENFPEEVPPLLLVDGVPVFDQSTFLKINNKLIESAEIVTDPIWLNPGTFRGVIQVSSFEGDARCITLPQDALRRSFLTFLPEKQFRTPNYLNQDNTLPDFRNTLYWNPDIKTDASGKAKIEVYTSDAIGEYEIIVEGVSKDGQLLGSKRASIQVVKDIN